MGSHTFKQSESFNYRFVCEHCEIQTEWLSATIYDQETVDVGFFENSEVKEIKFMQRFNNEIYSEKKKKILNGEYGESYDIKGKCPNCGKRQSWESATTSIGMWIGMLILCLIIGLIVFTYGFIIMGGIILLGVPISIIGIIVDTVKKAKVHSDASKTTNRNKPEFEFFK